MTPKKADMISFWDTTANRIWVTLQHSLALVRQTVGAWGYGWARRVCDGSVIVRLQHPL